MARVPVSDGLPDNELHPPRAPVAADLVCPASGAGGTGRVVHLDGESAVLVLPDPRALRGFDVGASVDVTFVSAVLGGTRTVRSRITRAGGDPPQIRVVFENPGVTPLGALFNRRRSLRLRPEALALGKQASIQWGDGTPVACALDDISLTGAAIVLPRKPVAPVAGDRVRLQVAGPDGTLTVWLSGAIRHVGLEDRHVRLGIEFDLQMADVEGAGPALRALVRQIQRVQVDQLLLAAAGIAPDQL